VNIPSTAKYAAVMAAALQLIKGRRNQDYNKGGMDVRDYWEVNGLASPVQMVDMKLKRARSAMAGMPVDGNGLSSPVAFEQVRSFADSCIDGINYLAFCVMEAMELAQHNTPASAPLEGLREMFGSSDLEAGLRKLLDIDAPLPLPGEDEED